MFVLDEINRYVNKSKRGNVPIELNIHKIGYRLGYLKVKAPCKGAQLVGSVPCGWNSIGTIISEGACNKMTSCNANDQ